MAKPRDVLELVHKKRSKERYDKGIACLRETLATPHGREALWYILDQTGMNAPSLWDGSSKIHYNVAIRDFGRLMMSLMVEASEQAVFDMQRLAWHRAIEERLEDRKTLEDQEG